MLRSCREEQGFGHFGVEDFEPGKRYEGSIGMKVCVCAKQKVWGA